MYTSSFWINHIPTPRTDTERHKHICTLAIRERIGYIEQKFYGSIHTRYVSYVFISLKRIKCECERVRTSDRVVSMWAEGGRR